jgi:large subunit ribosomal protein L28
MPKINTNPSRKTTRGYRVTTRGLPKKTGGIGLNITGKARRTIKRNLQRKKIRFSDGTVRTMWVRAKDLKAGKYDNPNKKDFLKHV